MNWKSLVEKILIDRATENERDTKKKAELHRLNLLPPQGKGQVNDKLHAHRSVGTSDMISCLNIGI